jgi:hypothetical protein
MLGELEMTATQLRAAELLLDRSVPKLAQVQHVGDEEGGPIALSLAVSYAEPDSTPTEG